MLGFTYTADSEEPDCGRCDHICDSDKYCIKNCGAEHAWGGYERTEIFESKHDGTVCFD